MEVMANNKLILTSFSAIAMITMAATMIATQETYAATITYVGDTFCGKNYQGSFHLSVGNPSLSIPPGHPPWTPPCLPDNTKTQSDH
jgi:hypothetical protein